MPGKLEVSDFDQTIAGEIGEASPETPEPHIVVGNEISTGTAISVVSAQSYEELLAFMERYQTYTNPMTNVREQAEVHLGILPPNLDIQLPLPPRSSLLGSVSWGEERHTAIVEAPGTPDEIFAYYEKHMPFLGFSLSKKRIFGGFENNLSNSQKTFCQDEGDLEFRVSATEVESRPTDLRLYLSSQREHSQCAQAEPHPGLNVSAQRYIPVLSAPPNAVIQSSGGGGGTDHFDSQVHVETSESADVIMGHYFEQLHDSDWTLVDEGQGERFLWSMWSFVDDKGRPWDGIFHLLQQPSDTESYFVMMQIILVN
jgi:hypothetical protein